MFSLFLYKTINHKRARTTINGKQIDLGKYFGISLYRFSTVLNKAELSLENYIEELKRVYDVVKNIESKRSMNKKVEIILIRSFK